jgi:hypothetical protein
MKAGRSNLMLLFAGMLVSLHLHSESAPLLRYSYGFKDNCIFQDSIPVIFYEFESQEMEFIIQVIMDSCVLKYDCDKLDQVFLSAEKSPNCFEFRIRTIRHSPFAPLYPSNISNLACISSSAPPRYKMKN